VPTSLQPCVHVTTEQKHCTRGYISQFYLEAGLMLILRQNLTNEGRTDTKRSVQVVVFWISSPCSDVVKTPTFRRTYAGSLHLEVGGSKVLRNCGILPHHYAMPKPTKRRCNEGMTERNKESQTHDKLLHP